MCVGAGTIAILRPTVFLLSLIHTGNRTHLQVRGAEDRVLGLDIDDALILPDDMVQHLQRVFLVVDLHRHDLFRPEVLHRVHRIEAEDQRPVDIRPDDFLAGNTDDSRRPVNLHAGHLLQKVDGIISFVYSQCVGVIDQRVTLHRHHRDFGGDRSRIQGLSLPLPGDNYDIFTGHQHE